MSQEKYYIAMVSITLLGLAGKGLWYVGSRIVRYFLNLNKTLISMETNFNTLMTNHLPHIEGELKSLRQDFNNHILKEGTYEIREDSSSY